MKLDTITFDFNNVLIRPQKQLASRSEVSLERTFTFKNSNANVLWQQIWIQQVHLAADVLQT